MRRLRPIKESKMELNEGLEQHDLKRLVHPELHVDEYKSKMGKDEDIVVLSFKVIGREPAQDLVNFVEKGYEWVIDADLSSGEMDDGDYLVFVEMDRTPEVAENIMQMIDEVLRLTDQSLDEWSVYLNQTKQKHPLNLEILKTNVASTPMEYLARYGKKELDEMRNAAGVPVTTKAPKNDYTQSLRSLAGII